MAPYNRAHNNKHEKVIEAAPEEMNANCAARNKKKIVNRKDIMPSDKIRAKAVRQDYLKTSCVEGAATQWGE